MITISFENYRSGNYMESIAFIVGLLKILSVLAFPQILGILAYLRIRRFHSLAAHLAGFLITTVLSFYFLQIMFFPPMAAQSPEGCGMAVAALAILLLFFTGIQTIVSFITQIILYRRYKKH